MRLTPEARQLLGMTPGAEPLVGLDRLPGPLLELVREVLASGASSCTRHVEFALQGRGNVALCAQAVLTHPDAPGSPLVLSLSDLSLPRSLEERLRRLDRLANAGTLATSMTHEIRNALVSCRTFVELLLEKHPNADMAGIVRRELGRIDAMIGRVLKFAGPASATFGPVHVHQVLEHSLRLVQPQVADKAIVVQRSFRATADLANGDEYELEQAFVNLLLNALEAMGHNGSLTISTESMEANGEPAGQKEAISAPRIRIAIQDTGPGIPPEFMAQLYQPFFTTKPNGTGLGLAVTDRVIRDHQGTIHAESQLGAGTTFTITLPRVTTR